MTKPPVLFYM